MTGTDLARVPNVHFGPFGERGAVAYVPPVNTLDPRYDACTDHRVACDCREAEWAEERSESRLRIQEIQDAFDQMLAGHQTYTLGAPNPYTGEEDKPCMCTGCQIAREAGILPRSTS